MFPSDLERISEPDGREQSRGRALTLDNRIRHKGRSVNQCPNLSGLYGSITEGLIERAFDSQAWIARSRQSLTDNGMAILAYHQEVGESPADVDAYAIHDLNTVSSFWFLVSDLKPCCENHVRRLETSKLKRETIFGRKGP